MSDFVVRWQDRDVRAEAELIGGIWWIHAEGEMVRIDPREGKAGKRNRGGGSGDGSLLSPMPGKITKILKAVGDQVGRGDAILVMEAMKMEYTLKSDVDGVVAEVSCAVGDQVGLGQGLASIQPKTGDA